MPGDRADCHDAQGSSPEDAAETSRDLGMLGRQAAVTKQLAHDCQKAWRQAADYQP